MAPLPRSDTGQFHPYILVLLQAPTWGHCPPKPVPLLGHAPSPTPHPSDWPRLPFSQTFTCINSLAISSQLFFLFTWSMTMEHSVLKCRHIKFRRLGITQKTEYNIQNMANFEMKNLISMLTSACQRLLISAKLIQCMSIQPCPLWTILILFFHQICHFVSYFPPKILFVHLISPIHVTCLPPTSLPSPPPPHPNDIKGQHEHGRWRKINTSLNQDMMTPKVYEKFCIIVMTDLLTGLKSMHYLV